MKKCLSLALALAWATIANAQNCGCDHTVTTSGYYGPANLPVQPGQTVCIKAGKYTNLQFSNFSGTAANPITFKNCGGVVEIENSTSTDAMAFANCKYFKVTGTGDSQQTYGIHVKGTGSGRMGLAVMDKSTDCEIDHVEINNAGFAGIMTKTDPWCDPATWQQNFTMYNVKIHDNYIHDCSGEGIYAGNSFYGGGSVITCSNQSITVYPHKIIGLEIHHNRIERTGAEGIQYGCSPDAKVYNNVVKSPGISPFANYQNNGIQIGDGSGGECYNNIVEDAQGVGIIFLSFASNQKIYNNLVVRAGSTGLFADKRVGSLPQATLSIYNNTFITPGGDAILLYSTENTHYVSNNALVGPGTGQYIKTASGVVTQNSNNYQGTLADAKFISATDFHPQSISPLLNKGKVVSGISKDYDGKIRPLQDVYDIGCYEVLSTLSAETPVAENPAPEAPVTEAPPVTDPIVTAPVVKPADPPATPGCNAIITTGGYYSASSLNIQPGQTVCIQAGTYTNLYLGSFIGTATAPITFKNYGGTVLISNTDNDGIVFNNCKHVIFTGTGQSSVNYGIVVQKTGSGRMGMVISSLSTNVEVDHVEIGNAGYVGIMAKTDPSCDQNTWRENFTMKEVKLHDNYIHDTGGPGIFAGHTSWASGVAVVCAGSTNVVYPHKMEGLKIYKNVLEKIGTTGIMYASAADAQVYENTITQAGYASYNMGIHIADGSGGLCYSNKVKQTVGTGIYITSLGANLSVYNNLVAGNSAYGIVSTSGAGGTAGMKLRIMNNTVVPTGQASIHLTNTLPTLQVYNNAMASPNGQYLQYASGVKLSQAGNYQTTVQNALFQSTETYLPADNSPLVNNGIGLDSLGVTVDIVGVARPQQGKYDIGCYEKVTGLNYMTLAEAPAEQEVQQLAMAEREIVFNVYPNPVVHSASVDLPEGHLESLQIFDVQSNLIHSQNTSGSSASVNLSGLPAGVYILSIPTAKGTLTKKIAKN